MLWSLPKGGRHGCSVVEDGEPDKWFSDNICLIEPEADQARNAQDKREKGSPAVSWIHDSSL